MQMNVARVLTCSRRDIMVACQDGCRLTFSKYGVGARCGCMPRWLPQEFLEISCQMVDVRCLVLVGWCGRGLSASHIRNCKRLAQWPPSYNSKNWPDLKPQLTRTVFYLGCKV